MTGSLNWLIREEFDHGAFGWANYLLGSSMLFWYSYLFYQMWFKWFSYENVPWLVSPRFIWKLCCPLLWDRISSGSSSVASSILMSASWIDSDSSSSFFLLIGLEIRFGADLNRNAPALALLKVNKIWHFSVYFSKLTKKNVELRPERFGELEVIALSLGEWLLLLVGVVAALGFLGVIARSNSFDISSSFVFWDRSG